MSTAAARQRTYRERKRDGKSVFTFTADEVHLKIYLENYGLLQRDEWDNVAAVQVAVDNLITLIMKENSDDYPSDNF